MGLQMLDCCVLHCRAQELALGNYKGQSLITPGSGGNGQGAQK